jgi:hypothetical protein
MGSVEVGRITFPDDQSVPSNDQADGIDVRNFLVVMRARVAREIIAWKRSLVLFLFVTAESSFLSPSSVRCIESPNR